MSQKAKYVVWLGVALAGYGVGSLALSASYTIYDLYSAYKAEPYFKDTAEIESEVCVKGNHVIVFTVLKKFDENIQIYVDQAGYKETFSVVVGKCSEKPEV